MNNGMVGYSNDLMRGTGYFDREDKFKRGLTVYTATELMGLAGHDKSGKIVQGEQEVPLFGLGVWDRINIYQKCDVVFGIITGRANRIAALDWSIQRESKIEDRLEYKLKQSRQLFKEYSDPALGVKGAIVRGRMIRFILSTLPDCLPDMSNFDRSLLRWKKNLQHHTDDSAQEIMDWLHQPNAHDTFDDFVKKWVGDLLTHGTDAIYKEFIDGDLQNIYHLPGGSTIPLKTKYISSLKMFAQVVPGFDTKIYYSDEVAFSTYMPTSGIAYGLIPIEALVNKIAEVLFFDQRAAEMADGTTPPQKLAVFGGEKLPFGGLSGDEAIEMPLQREEQSRLETLLNEPRKNAIRVLTGQGTPAILDLSRSDTFRDQSDRQKFIRETAAFVFNATNMEVNLTGSDGTSGRNTSETQTQIEKEKGTYPILKIIESQLNFNILPHRFGSDYKFEYKSGLDERQQAELDLLLMQTGTWTPNEIREARGADIIDGEQNDQLPNGTSAAPDGSKASPINMRQLA